MPQLAAGIFQEVDMMERSEIIDFINKKSDYVNNGIRDLIAQVQSADIKNTLQEVLDNESFVVKYKSLKRYKRRSGM